METKTTKPEGNNILYSGWGKWLLLVFIHLVSLKGFSQPATFNEALITDFYQGKVIVSEGFQNCVNDHVLGNCVAVALIKTALGEFGTVSGIYKNYSEQNDLINIEFADGIKAEINKQEIEIVQRLSGITKADDSKFYDAAIIIYASICKRVLVQKNIYSAACIRDFTSAVEYINSGFPTKDAHTLLGLKKVPLPVSDLQTTQAAIVWCSAHAAYCSYAKQDLLGSKIFLKKNKMMNLKRYSRISDAYRLTK